VTRRGAAALDRMRPFLPPQIILIFEPPI
jgi:hypothetical protein